MATELYTNASIKSLLDPVLDPITSAYDRFKVDRSDKEEQRIHKQISDLQSELNEKYSILNTDNDILCSVYRDIGKVQKDGLGAAVQIKEALEELKLMTAEMEEELMKYLIEDWGSGKSWEEMFASVFDPIMQAIPALTNITQTLGLGQIPLIGVIPNLLQKFSDLGRIISKLPKEVRDEARKAAEEAEKAKKEERQKGMTWSQRQYDNVKNSMFGRVIDEIIEVFKAVFELIEFILNHALLFAVLMIIDKFKPVIDMFKIALGDAIELLYGIKEVGIAMIQGKYAIMKLLWKVLFTKLENLYNIIVYVTSGTDLPSNALISACLMDIVSCECDISSLQLSLDHEMVNLDMYNNYKLQDAYKDEEKDIEKTLKELNAEVPVDNEKIKIETANLTSIQEDQKELEDRILSGKEDQKKTKESYDFFEENKDKKYRNILKERTDQNEYLKLLNTPAINIDETVKLA